MANQVNPRPGISTRDSINWAVIFAGSLSVAALKSKDQAWPAFVALSLLRFIEAS